MYLILLSFLRSLFVYKQSMEREGLDPDGGEDGRNWEE